MFDSLLPEGLRVTNPIGTDSTSIADNIVDLIQNGLILLFIIVILVAIIFSVLAGLKYIQSQGEADKVEEAQKALKSVLFGVGAVFIGIIGVIVITSLFSNTSSINVRNSLKCMLGDSVACDSNTTTNTDTTVDPADSRGPGG